MKNKDTVINVNPFHSDLSIGSNGKFTITFYDNVGKDYTRRKLVKVHFESYWIRFLARMIWKVIRDKEAELQRDKRSMSGEY